MRSVNNSRIRYSLHPTNQIMLCSFQENPYLPRLMLKIRFSFPPYWLLHWSICHPAQLSFFPVAILPDQTVFLPGQKHSSLTGSTLQCHVDLSLRCHRPLGHRPVAICAVCLRSHPFC